MKMKVKLPVIVFTSALAISGAALAQPLHGGPGERFERMAEELQLDEQQKTQVRAIMDAAREKGRAQMQALREQTRAELEDVLTPEQLQKFDAMAEKRRERYQERKRQHRREH